MARSYPARARRAHRHDPGSTTDPAIVEPTTDPLLDQPTTDPSLDPPTTALPPLSTDPDSDPTPVPSTPAPVPVLAPTTSAPSSSAPTAPDSSSLQTTAQTWSIGVSFASEAPPTSLTGVVPSLTAQSAQSVGTGLAAQQAQGGSSGGGTGGEPQHMKVSQGIIIAATAGGIAVLIVAIVIGCLVRKGRRQAEKIRAAGRGVNGDRYPVPLQTNRGWQRMEDEKSVFSEPYPHEDIFPAPTSAKTTSTDPALSSSFSRQPYEQSFQYPPSSHSHPPPSSAYPNPAMYPPSSQTRPPATSGYANPLTPSSMMAHRAGEEENLAGRGVLRTAGHTAYQGW